MDKEEKKEALPEPLTGGPFEVDEEVVFMPHAAPEQDGVIIGLPAEGSSKYTVRLADGSTYPINPCYLRKK